MSEKSEALRLAGALTAATEQTDAEDDVIHVARWFVEDAAAELGRLNVYEYLLRDWLDRTDWVQETARPHELGMHRADVMRQRLEQAETQRDALLEALCELLADAEFLGWDTAKARAAIKSVEGEKE